MVDVIGGAHSLGDRAIAALCTDFDMTSFSSAQRPLTMADFDLNWIAKRRNPNDSHQRLWRKSHLHEPTTEGTRTRNRDYRCGFSWRDRGER
jgi:hypothetical protein